ncbi:MAG: head decoration protein [Pseudomonadota bacterium]
MAKKILIPYDFAQNEIQNAVAQVLAAAPSSPVPGQFYYDSTAGRWKYRAAGAWIDPTDRATHTGSQAAATISDLATTVKAYRLDEFAAPTADVSMGGRKLTSLANGTVATDAATYGQLLNLLNGTDWKSSVRVATTANLAVLSGLLTIDDVTLVAGDRVLVKNQDTAADNGLYVAASGAWARAADADTTLNPDGSAKLSASTTVFVEEGSTLADTQWRITTNGVIVVGTTAIAWGQIGAGTSYTSGTGINVAGNVINVDTGVVVRKHAETIGDGATATITVTHNLGTKDITASVREVATDDFVECGIKPLSPTQAAFSFGAAPALNSLRVVIHG